ncbi:MAG: hypothetical protein O8C67_05010 [Candidatus Methanoperedens sp.]|nr:hypothetical protein [Candidatus Methanoperedens sp.]
METDILLQYIINSGIPVRTSGQFISVTNISGQSIIVGDAFADLRLAAIATQDIGLAVDQQARMRTFIDATSPTATIAVNVSNIGGIPSAGFIFDEMDINYNTGIRQQIA